jgi:hypothetical protein
MTQAGLLPSVIWVVLNSDPQLAKALHRQAVNLPLSQCIHLDQPSCNHAAQAPVAVRRINGEMIADNAVEGDPGAGEIDQDSAVSVIQFAEGGEQQLDHRSQIGW